MVDIDTRLAENLRAYNENRSRLENIQHELPDLGVSVQLQVPEQAKREALDELYRKHNAVYQQLADEKREQVSRALGEAASRVFDFRTSGAFAHELAVSKRDARDRLAGVTDPAEMSRRLETAAEDNDTVMARMILRKAAELGQDFGGGQLVDKYLELYPGEVDAYNAYITAAEDYNRLLMMGVSFSPERPQDASRTFKSSAGGEALIPDNIVTSTITSPTVEEAGPRQDVITPPAATHRPGIPDGIPVAE